MSKSTLMASGFTVALLLSGCGSDSGASAADASPDIGSAPVPVVVDAEWATQVDGIWKVGIENVTCPETADDLYRTIASAEFPFVSSRAGTEEHAWPAGDVAGVVTCTADSSTGTGVERHPSEGRYPVLRNAYEGGDGAPDFTEVTGLATEAPTSQ